MVSALGLNLERDTESLRDSQASSTSNRSSQHDSKTDNKSLRAELLSYFNSKMPCVAFKAGKCELSGANGDASLRPAVEAVQRGIAVFLVDMEVREQGSAVDLKNVKDDSVPKPTDVKDDSTPVEQGKKRAVLQRADSLKIFVEETAELQKDLRRQNQDTMDLCQKELKDALASVHDFSAPVKGFDVCELAYTLELYERHSPLNFDAFMPLWIQLEISEADRDDLVSLNFRESHDIREDFVKLGERTSPTDCRLRFFSQVHFPVVRSGPRFCGRSPPMFGRCVSVVARVICIYIYIYLTGCRPQPGTPTSSRTTAASTAATTTTTTSRRRRLRRKRRRTKREGTIKRIRIRRTKKHQRARESCAV